MRNIMIFAAILIGLGTFMAQLAERMAPRPASASMTASPATVGRSPAPASAAVQSGLRSLSIPRDHRGHFLTEGRIDGQRIGFQVDTAASAAVFS